MQGRPLRFAAALVAVLLGGLILLSAGLHAASDAVGPAATISAPAEEPGPAVTLGRSWGSSWPWAAAAAPGIVVGAAALLASRLRPSRRPGVAWCLTRPDRMLPTARHCSPLAARRAPPAPAGC